MDQEIWIDAPVHAGVEWHLLIWDAETTTEAIRSCGKAITVPLPCSIFFVPSLSFLLFHWLGKYGFNYDTMSVGRNLSVLLNV